MMVQLTLDEQRAIGTDEAAKLMESALVWIDENHGAWSLLVEWAHRDADRYQHVSVKLYLEELRRDVTLRRPMGSPVKLKNALSPAFSRILLAWYPKTLGGENRAGKPVVPTAPSKLDGCIIPPKPAWLL